MMFLDQPVLHALALGWAAVAFIVTWLLIVGAERAWAWRSRRQYRKFVLSVLVGIAARHPALHVVDFRPGPAIELRSLPRAASAVAAPELGGWVILFDMASA